MQAKAVSSRMLSGQSGSLANDVYAFRTPKCHERARCHFARHRSAATSGQVHSKDSKDWISPHRHFTAPPAQWNAPYPPGLPHSNLGSAHCVGFLWLGASRGAELVPLTVMPWSCPYSAFFLWSVSWGEIIKLARRADRWLVEQTGGSHLFVKPFCLLSHSVEERHAPVVV